MYSQNNEESIIKSFFQKNNLLQGKFMDIGAFHPFTFSNTRCLYELGWKGVLAEPSPACLRNLYNEYTYDKRITIVPKAVVTTESGFVNLYDSNGDALSTTNKAHKNMWSKNANIAFNKIPVESINIVQLINQYGINTDFLSLDVEGENINIFNSIPVWFLNRLHMLCIEHDGMQHYVEEKLKPLGFETALVNNENIIMKKSPV